MVLDCSRRHARCSTSSSVEEEASTCSDCSLEVEADLSGWKGLIADSWDKDIDEKVEERDKEENKVNGKENGKEEDRNEADDEEAISSEENTTNSCGGAVGGLRSMGGAALRGSTLVLQTREGSFHLADGLSREERRRMMLRRRRKREGTVKLHVARGHAFVAKHVKG